MENPLLEAQLSVVRKQWSVASSQLPVVGSRRERLIPGLLDDNNWFLATGH